MTTLSVRLPESLHRNAKLFAEREGTSLNQLLATALAEKLAALGAEEVLQARAQRADEAAFRRALAEVPDTAAETGDDWP
jgi:hypothetical protein